MIYSIESTTMFSKEQAVTISNILRTLSIRTKQDLSILNARLANTSNSELKVKTQEEINVIIQKWSNQVRKLGCIPIALHKVRVPSDDHSFVWSLGNGLEQL